MARRSLPTLLLVAVACSSQPPSDANSSPTERRAVMLGPGHAIVVTQTTQDQDRQRAFVNSGAARPDYAEVILRGEVEVGMTDDEASASWGLHHTDGSYYNGGGRGWMVQHGGVWLGFEGRRGSLRLATVWGSNPTR